MMFSHYFLDFLLIRYVGISSERVIKMTAMSTVRHCQQLFVVVVVVVAIAIIGCYVVAVVSSAVVGVVCLWVHCKWKASSPIQFVVVIHNFIVIWFGGFYRYNRRHHAISRCLRNAKSCAIPVFCSSYCSYIDYIEHFHSFFLFILRILPIHLELNYRKYGFLLPKFIIKNENFYLKLRADWSH